MIDWSCFIYSLVIFFTDECVDDSDCSNQGSCINIKATTFPQRQCFCNPGWFGESCSRGKPLILIFYDFINVKEFSLWF